MSKKAAMNLGTMWYFMEIFLKNLICIPNNLILILILRANMFMQVWNKYNYNPT